MSVQVVKVLEKPEWPKFYVNVKTGARVRCFSKSDVPRKHYLLEAEYEAVKLEAQQENAKEEAMATLKAGLKAKKAV
jgi:hypothetical protein